MASGVINVVCVQGSRSVAAGSSVHNESVNPGNHTRAAAFVCGSNKMRKDTFAPDLGVRWFVGAEAFLVRPQE